MKYFFSFFILGYFFLSITQAMAQQSWPQFVAGVRQEALSQGIRPEIFDEAFQNIKAPNPKILHLDRSQPEHRLSFLNYLNSRVDHDRIRLGQSEFRKNKDIFNNIDNRFGVNPCIVASIWGMETSYGHYKGNFPVITSLATLAYDDRRASFFRKELLLALHMVNDGYVSLKDFKGEWAGASGHSQFLPSSWKRYAYDYYGDGKKDIWNRVGDGLASIANYLVMNGWQKSKPWYIAVAVPANLQPELINTKVFKPVNEWVALGVKPLNGAQFPNENIPAAIIMPDGGPALMVFKNFKVIMSLNHSIYYAGAIGYLANQICVMQ